MRRCRFADSTRRKARPEWRARLLPNAVLRRRANASDLRIPSDMQKSDPARCFIVQNGYCDAAVLDNVMRSAYYIRQFMMHSRYLFGRRRGFVGEACVAPLAGAGLWFVYFGFRGGSSSESDDWPSYGNARGSRRETAAGPFFYEEGGGAPAGISIVRNEGCSACSMNSREGWRVLS